MKEQYDPKTVEASAQEFWAKTKAFEVSENSVKPKFYCLSMLPYPSGALHMGHVRNYTLGDVISRYKRSQGYNVLQPMGWDAFGLPAENAAIKHQVPPAKWTYANIDNMRRQLKALGYAYDWSREITTCKPEYYRWEQLLFTRLFKKGLVYRKNSVVNWDPIDQTVLANEQVIDGRGWRSGALVERREIPQWFFKITAYAEELLNELDQLDEWPEAVKTMQRNWIGRSEGLEIQFALEDTSETLTVYTTRPDTLFGVSYLAVAAEHPLARRAATTNLALMDFCKTCTRTGVAEAEIETMEKSGMATGLYALHPITQERVPIWVANFVLMGYGTGAVMAVPAHDQRDFEFAKKYCLPIRQVIQPFDSNQNVDLEQSAFVAYGVCINSGKYTGLKFQEAFEAIAHDLVQLKLAVRKINYRLRDWGVSRQRYWGCPIPIIYRADGTAVPVPEEQLPVLLPEDVRFEGVKSPIKADEQWRKTSDPETGEPAERETDTFDTFVESSWYYARYCTPGANDILDERANYWLPVDQYIGGIEHAVMHLLYFRFWHKLLRDVGLVQSNEPALKLLCQGMVIAETFYREDEQGAKTYFNPADVDVVLDSKGKAISARLKNDASQVSIGATEKMSKSKNNGVDPQTLVDIYGADTVRLFSMFAAPPEQSLEWNDAGVEGMSRFLRRVWNLVFKHAHLGATQKLETAMLNAEQKSMRRHVHETIVKVADDMGRRQVFNTAIAAIMELINALSKFDDQSVQGRALLQEAWEAITLLLNPITPHFSHALWQALGHAETLLEDLPFPKPDADALVRDKTKWVVQINGKLRSEFELPISATRDEVELAARSDSTISRMIGDQTIRKIIVVPGKLVNIVVG
jgi:leucyl-tRNA synthetase